MSLKAARFILAQRDKFYHFAWGINWLLHDTRAVTKFVNSLLLKTMNTSTGP